MGLREWWANLWGPIEDVPAARSGSVAVTEAGLPPLLVGNDPDINLTLAQGGGPTFRRLSQTQRDLSVFTLDRGRQLGWQFFETNPLGKRILEVIRDYILGEDVALVVAAESEDEGAKSTQERRQEIVDQFWTHPLNRLGSAIDDYVLDLGMLGELCLRVAVNPANGQVGVAYVDSEAISTVILDPRNPLLPAVVVLKGVTGGPTERLKVVQVDLDSLSPTYGRMVGARTDTNGNVTETYQETEGGEPRRYLGSCFFWAINKPVSASRGRSDLLALADWLDAVDQILFGEVDRQLLMKSFVWDVTLTGFTDTQITDWLVANGTPPLPGSLRAHNEKAIWAAVSPDLQSYDTAKVVDVLIGHIAVGAGIPKTWLSSTDDVNRATATELSEPTFKRLTRRQKLVKSILTTLGSFALDQAELAGVLGEKRATKAGQLPAPWPLTAQMPELRPKDLVAGATAMNQLASALSAMRADGAIDAQVHQDAAVLGLGTIGLEVDTEAMRERIETEEAERKAEEEAMMSQMGGPDEGGPPTNGNGRPPARMAVVARGGGG